MWTLITVGILGVLVILAGMYALRREKTGMHPMEKGMALGGIAGVLIGIALVEFWGYDYPVPVILWMLGMGAGQLVGWFYGKKRKDVPA